MAKEKLSSLLSDALASASATGDLSAKELPPIIIEIPANENFGDYSSNLAMLLAKPERKAPIVIAECLKDHLKDSEGILEDVRVEKPGFINFYLNTSFLASQLSAVLADPAAHGRSNWGKGSKVLLEFVSANPTGPLHVGHGRGAAVGDALARILKASGFDVHREYYVNNFGNQMDMLGRSTHLRYLESKGETIEFPEEGYQGDYIREIAASESYREKVIVQGENDPEAELRRSVEASASVILDDIKDHLEEFRVIFDDWFNESSLYKRPDHVDEVIRVLEGSSGIYEKDGAKWLHSSKYGDEKDRVVVRDDGRPTYLASDIAYHHLKFRRGFDRCINIWGADHHGYLPRVRASLEMLGHDPSKLDVLFVQFVSLRRGGKPVQMSTRSGQFEELSTVVREVGVDAARFYFLMRSVDSTLEFDLDLAKEQTSENPVYYVQYAHARTCSLFRQAEERGESADDLTDIPEDGLSLPEEHALAKSVLEWPDIVRMAAERLEPHRISFGLMAIAKDFHAYYNRHRILGQKPDITRARLCLVRCIQAVLSNGLDLLGVSAPNQM
ncbi:MAG: arginine--tRNA ligase [bacterium]